jgi:hypothetical protein
MKKGRFLWSAHRITERQKAGKARSIKGKQLKNSRSTASKLHVALRSSASDNFLSQDNSIRVATPQDFGSGEFFVSQEITSYETKTLREDRHGAEENFAAETTRRRRRSLRAGFFLIFSV